MKDVIARLKEHQSLTPSKWRERAEWRQQNKSWLRHSQRIAVMMHEKMAPGAQLILSGFYTADIPMLTEKAQSLGMKLVAQEEDNDWACVVLRN